MARTSSYPDIYGPKSLPMLKGKKKKKSKKKK